MSLLEKRIHLLRSKSNKVSLWPALEYNHFQEENDIHTLSPPTFAMILCNKLGYQSHIPYTQTSFPSNYHHLILTTRKWKPPVIENFLIILSITIRANLTRGEKKKREHLKSPVRERGSEKCREGGRIHGMTYLRHHATVLVFNTRKHCNAAVCLLGGHLVRGGRRTSRHLYVPRRGTTVKRRLPLVGFINNLIKP